MEILFVSECDLVLDEDEDSEQETRRGLVPAFNTRSVIHWEEREGERTYQMAVPKKERVDPQYMGLAVTLNGNDSTFSYTPSRVSLCRSRL